MLNYSLYVSEVLFESMPMMHPTSFMLNDTHFSDQWNMTRIQAGGPGDYSLGFLDWQYYCGDCILDSGCDLTHPDLQFSTQGRHIYNNQPDESPVNPRRGLTPMPDMKLHLLIIFGCPNRFHILREFIYNYGIGGISYRRDITDCS